MLNYYDVKTVLKEIPGEVALSFSITGCCKRCKGCHSDYLWDMDSGKPLTEDVLNEYITKYAYLLTCVLFMGGDWDKEYLIKLLKIAKSNKLKTALYTGENQVDKEIVDLLDYLKTGKYIAELGGLGSKSTNQKFIEVKSGNNLNHLFL